MVPPTPCLGLVEIEGVEALFDQLVWVLSFADVLSGVRPDGKLKIGGSVDGDADSVLGSERQRAGVSAISVLLGPRVTVEKLVRCDGERVYVGATLAVRVVFPRTGSVVGCLLKVGGNTSLSRQSEGVRGGLGRLGESGMFAGPRR